MPKKPPKPIEIPVELLEALAPFAEVLEQMAPGAFGLGVGLKEKGGKLTKTLALCVYVLEKKAVGDIPAAELVPEEFLGIPTDVVEYRPVLAWDRDKYNPLEGGAGISGEGVKLPDGTSDVGSGTLGAVVRDRQTGERLLLTCNHVFFTEQRTFRGKETYQPPRGETGQQLVGEFVRGDDQVDCAVIRPNSARGLRNAVLEAGPVRGKALAGSALPVWVKKRGSRTTLTFGLVIRLVIGVPGALRWTNVDPFTTRVWAMMEVASWPPNRAFCWQGDSGSVLLDTNDNVVGQIFAGQAEGPPVPHQVPAVANGFATFIDDVEDALQVDIAVSPGITSLSPTSVLGMVATTQPVVIEGWGFTSDSVVSFGGMVAVVLTRTAASTLTVMPPLHLPGTVDVQVTNEFGEHSENGPQTKFTYDKVL